jgi:hypothetical protein
MTQRYKDIETINAFIRRQENRVVEMSLELGREQAALAAMERMRDELVQIEIASGGK